MGLGSFFSSLFGGAGKSSGTARQGKPVDHQGYTIIPIPRSHNGQYITAGVIQKTVNDQPLEEPFVRADTHQSFESACDHAVTKGRQIIDEQGDRLFSSPAPASQPEP